MIDDSYPITWHEIMMALIMIVGSILTFTTIVGVIVFVVKSFK